MKPKRPIKADYITKYGFEGERIWRYELLKYNEAKKRLRQDRKVPFVVEPAHRQAL